MGVRECGGESGSAGMGTGECETGSAGTRERGNAGARARGRANARTAGSIRGDGVVYTFAHIATDEHLDAVGDLNHQRSIRFGPAEKVPGQSRPRSRQAVLADPTSL